MQSVTITTNCTVRMTLHDGKKYKQKRNIGKISPDGNTYIVERSPNCIMKVNNSNGLNYELMRDGQFENVVVYFSDGTMLQTKRQVVLDYGQFWHFAKNNLEVQKFLCLTDFARDPKPKKIIPTSYPAGHRCAPKPPTTQIDMFGLGGSI